MLLVVGLDLDGTDGTLTGVHIRRVVHVRAVLLLQLLKHHRQLGQRLAFQLASQLRILGHGREVIAFEHRLDVEPCPSAEDGHCSPLPDLLIGVEEVLLILEEVVLCARLADVDEMIGHALIVSQVLACADVHPAVHLSRVGRDDFSANPCCKGCCQGCLP